MLSRLFKRKPAKLDTSEPIGDDPVVVVPIPPLVTLLVALEKDKGAPLTRDEVVKVRDGAVCMTMRRSAAWKLAEQRGYRDLDPENIWDEWVAFNQTPCGPAWSLYSRCFQFKQAFDGARFREAAGGKLTGRNAGH